MSGVLGAPSNQPIEIGIIQQILNLSTRYPRNAGLYAHILYIYWVNWASAWAYSPAKREKTLKRNEETLFIYHLHKNILFTDIKYNHYLYIPSLFFKKKKKNPVLENINNKHRLANNYFPVTVVLSLTCRQRKQIVLVIYPFPS